MLSFYLVSLGCPKNLADAQVIAGTLLKNGAVWCDSPEDADCYCVNTCAFLPEARAEAYAEIARGVEWKRRAPGRKLLVSGCLSHYPDQGKKERDFPEVDYWLGVDDIARLPEILSGLRPVSRTTKYLCNENTPQLQLTLPHLAYVKIADGCNNRCSYCAIPNLRGALRSRPADSVVNEVRQLIANQVKEIILVAQDVTAFGNDRPNDGENLARLLGRLDQLDGDFKIRLLYTHPAHYSEELFAALGQLHKICHYIDLPLQHISRHLLDAMRRHTTPEQIYEIISRLRGIWPDLTLRTTFITGLPGETEADFAELMHFVREIKFDRLGVFPYAREPGTPAADFSDQVPTETAERRAAAIMRYQLPAMRRRLKKTIGSEISVLIDRKLGRRQYLGRSDADAPDIDNVIYLTGNGTPGCRHRVLVTGSYGSDLVGKIIAEH